MIIVESQYEINDFLNHWGNETSMVIPIWADLEQHPMNTHLSFLYVRFESGNYIIPFDHNDCEKVDIDLSQSTQTKWVWNKKGILQTDLGLQSVRDIQTETFFHHNNLIDITTFTDSITNFYTRLGLRDGLGKSIPIMKWVEVLNNMSNSILPLLPKNGNIEKNSFLPLSWIDTIMIPILSDVEKRGLRVETEKFFDRWPANGKQLKGDTIWTEYNPYTLTSRPSNRHGGINFGALNKKDGSREIFIPRENTMFLQFDYDAYHVRIIGKLIGYELPQTSVHQWLADQYQCPYDESKGRTFRILYGGVSDEDREIPFFNKVDEFIQRVYTQTQSTGFLTTPKGRKIPLSWIEGENPQKVFNYLLQATETEFNMEVLKKLKDGGIDLPILYTYDSFLFEYHLSWDTERAKEIKSVLESFGFPIKASWGMDYSKI